MKASSKPRVCLILATALALVAVSATPASSTTYYGKWYQPGELCQGGTVRHCGLLLDSELSIDWLEITTSAGVTNCTLNSGNVEHAPENIFWRGDALIHKWTRDRFITSSVGVKCRVRSGEAIYSTFVDQD